MQQYRATHSRSFLSSSGFGTMGYGLPAAIGAKVACPERQVIDIDGDGSLNMTIHELATCHRFKVGVKVVVINNQWLGMVRQWQDMIYDKHRSGSDMSDPLAAAEGDIYPNFLKIAEGYGVTSERVGKRLLRFARNDGGAIGSVRGQFEVSSRKFDEKNCDPRTAIIDTYGKLWPGLLG